jgi:hypothetical protein
VYADKAAFDADVANPATDTTADDFQQIFRLPWHQLLQKAIQNYN